MPQPFDYRLSGQSTIQRAMSGYEAAQNRKVQQQQVANQTAQVNINQQQLDMQKQAVQDAKAKAVALKDSLETFIQKPNKRGSDYADMIAKHPELAEEIKQSYEIMDEEAQRSSTKTAAQVYAAIASGNTEVARDLLNDRIEAAKNTGDDQEAKTTEAFLKLIDASPDSAKTTAGLYLASVSGEDDFAETFKTLDEVEKERELHPGEVKKQNAEIVQSAADLGLTKAQTNKFMADTRKLGADTKKTILEVEALAKGGVVDPQKKFEMERKLRQEYNKEVGPFVETQDAYRKINAAENTAAGDISLVISYMKMLDPGSVVREGEFATAQNAAGWPDRMRNTWNKIQDGTRLTPGQRKEFKSQAKKLMDASKVREGEVRKGLRPTISKYGLDTDTVFYVGQEPEPGSDEDDEADTSQPPTGFVLDQ